MIAQIHRNHVTDIGQPFRDHPPVPRRAVEAVHDHQSGTIGRDTMFDDIQHDRDIPRHAGRDQPRRAGRPTLMQRWKFVPEMTVFMQLTPVHRHISASRTTSCRILARPFCVIGGMVPPPWLEQGTSGSTIQILGQTEPNKSKHPDCLFAIYTNLFLAMLGFVANFG